MLEHLLFTEKYRPKTIAECILPDRLKTPFQEYVNQNNIPNLLLPDEILSEFKVKTSGFGVFIFKRIGIVFSEISTGPEEPTGIVYIKSFTE